MGVDDAAIRSLLMSMRVAGGALQIYTWRCYV